jgi:SAM-dependent methyltransferase
VLTDLLPIEQDWTRTLVRGRLDLSEEVVLEPLEADRLLRNRADDRWCEGASPRGQARPSRALARAHEATVGHRVAPDGTGGWAYRVQPGHTRGSGADFTPPQLIRFMVKATLGRWLSEADRSPADLRGLRVLDPACGAGMFLAEALDLLVEWWADHQGSRVDPGRLAQDHLVGLDVDPRAVATARRVLALRVREHGGVLDPSSLEAAIRMGNTLVPGTLDGDFDVVVGNPPYVFGEYVDPEARTQWATHFTLGRAGQPDAFKLFYERTAGQLLRPGGVHGFVVPDAMLGRDGHADLRRWLLRHLRLVQACHVGPVFRRGGVAPDGALERARRVGVSGVVVIGQRDEGGEVADTIEVDHWTESGPVAGHRVSASLAARLDGSPWVLHAPEGWLGSDGLRSQMERVGATLADVLRPGTAGLTRGEELGKQALGERDEDPSQIPIYSGDCVRRYRARPPRLQGPRDALEKAERVYMGPKVLFVKTGAGPVAACVADDFPALQSVYLLHVQPDVPVQVVVGLLNSALVTAYSWYQWTSAKRLQPQFTLGNLRSIPLPRVTASDAEGLCRAVAGAEAATDQAAPEMEYAVDRCVAALYGLHLEEIMGLLAPALDSIPPSQRPAWWGHPDFSGAASVR